MPESTFLCIDTSEYTRNSDFGGMTRLMGITDACNLITGAKLQSNPENTIGFLTMGGNQCKVHESLTSDFDRMLASLARIRTQGTVHFVEGLRIGALALAHRANNRGEKRLIAFVASPLELTEDALSKLGKKLRKDEIAVDVINVGHEENAAMLNIFVDTVNKNSNSTFVQVVAPMNIPDFVISTSVVGGGSMGGGAGGSGFEFGVDPNMDPELAMVLRQSAEEERLRQEALAASGGSVMMGTTHNPSTSAGGQHNIVPTHERTDIDAGQLQEDADTFDDDMDEELRMALELSRQEGQHHNPISSSSTSTQHDPTGTGTHAGGVSGSSEEEDEMRRALQMSKDQEDIDDVFDDAVHNEQFLADVARECDVEPSSVLELKRLANDNDKKST